MAHRLGFFRQWLGGEWADRTIINRNADVLESVEVSVATLQATVAQQADEILRLRAMIMGLADVLNAKLPFAEAELDSAVNAAWQELAPKPQPRLGASPSQATSGDPYRSMPTGEPSAEDIAAAKALLRVAEEHHFGKRFAEARATYREIVERYGETKPAAVARQQLVNLRGA